MNIINLFAVAIYPVPDVQLFVRMVHVIRTYVRTRALYMAISTVRAQ